MDKKNMKRFFKKVIIGLVVSILFFFVFYVLSPKYQFLLGKYGNRVIRANRITGGVEVIKMYDKLKR